MGRLQGSEFRVQQTKILDDSGLAYQLAAAYGAVLSQRNLADRRAKKAPENNGSEGGSGLRGFRERLDGAAHFLVCRAACDRGTQRLAPASMPASSPGGPQRRLALTARAPDAGPANSRG